MSDSDAPVRRSKGGKSTNRRKPVKQAKGGMTNKKGRRAVIEDSSSSESEQSESDDQLSSEEEEEEVMDIPSGSDSEDEKPRKKKKDCEETSQILPGQFELPGEDEQPKVWVLVGACASGKTYMLKYIHYRYGKQKHFKFGVTYTPTAYTGDYSWAPERSIMAFNEAHFEAYMDNLKKKVEEGVAKHGKGFKLPHNYVIFDDNNGTLTASPFMINFISTHRHTSTTVFMLSQLLTARGSVSTSVRANTSFALMWPTASKKDLKGLIDTYSGEMTPQEFKDALSSCRSREFSCLVLKNSAKNVTVQEQFTTIKAGEFPEDFQLNF